jgi:hypothetical protein
MQFACASWHLQTESIAMQAGQTLWHCLHPSTMHNIPIFAQLNQGKAAFCTEKPRMNTINIHNIHFQMLEFDNIIWSNHWRPCYSPSYNSRCHSEYGSPSAEFGLSSHLYSKTQQA